MLKEIKVFDQTHLEKKIALVIGTRPGIVMFAPIIHELCKTQTAHLTIHTGQHYSPNMDIQFFEDLKLPVPHYKLTGISEKKTHGGQTASMLEGIEKILMKERPKIVLVGGDANTNLAGALAARKLRMIVGHVEAGERSYDWFMPEEHNRRMIDHISDILFVTGEKGRLQLQKENIQGHIYITGNPIVDASIQHLNIAEKQSQALKRMNLRPSQYCLMTLHREENVDFQDRLTGALNGVSLSAKRLNLPIIFLAHPRTQKRLREFNLSDWAEGLPGITIMEPVGYLDFLNLIAHAKLVFTDSGGVQQEACIHQVPTVTLRENTEWVETLNIGANILAGTAPERIVASSEAACLSACHWEIPFGDGTSAQKIVAICRTTLQL